MAVSSKDMDLLWHHALVIQKDHGQFTLIFGPIAVREGIYVSDRPFRLYM